MTSLLARILLAIIMFPLAAVLYLVVFVALERQLVDAFAFLWTTVVVAFFVVLCWLALWRQSVRWTRTRVAGTVAAGLGSMVVGGVVGAFVAAVVPFGGEEFAIFVGGTVAILVWLAVTVLLWKETAWERAERVKRSAGDVLFCPKCSYNMTGLYEGRCPECGTRYTLDQLYAAQRRDGIGDTEEARPGRPG